MSLEELRVRETPEQEPRVLTIPEAPENSHPPSLPARAARPLQLYKKLAKYMAVTDVFCIAAALLLAYYIRFGTHPLQPFFPPSYSLLVAAAPIVWLGTFHAFQLYAPQRLSTIEEFRRVASATSVGVLAMSIMSFWTYSAFSRVVVGLTWVFAIVFEFSARWLWQNYANRLRDEGQLTLRTLVFGRAEYALDVAERIRSTGFDPVGFAAPFSELAQPHSPQAWTPAEIADRIREDAIDCLYVVPDGVSAEEVVQIVKIARRAGIELRIDSRIPELLSTRLSVHPIAGQMAMAIRLPSLSGPQIVLKRCFDLVVVIPGLVLVGPVLMILAAAVKITSHGAVLFKQQRVTKGGETFSMLKFRTMVADADQLMGERGLDRSEAFFKVSGDDPAVTRVGRFLRRFSLDELPQLLNVLKGDMSLVGPRPLPHDQVAANLDLLAPRHEVAAGMTGWWQVSGRSDIEHAKDAVEFDLFYIENWSLALDIFIMLRTVGAVLARTGAR